MNELSKNGCEFSPEQQAIRAKCFHPLGTFVEFPIEKVEQSIPERFEKIVRLYPRRMAIRIDGDGLNYDQLNCAAATKEG